ncbi:MAG: cobyrinate a,c-diamide synthase [Clostridia bacterium]|nr:cobyrinate a,c-diamide synthase [Clostridia bacterium]
MALKRIMIAGIQSGVGKTTLTLGIMAALRKQGLKVQPYKVGPDYIDPGLHYHASGRKSHNLDSWMMDSRVIETIFRKNARDADVSLVEGVMGLFDGAKGERLIGSSAHIALILNLPVILVVNAKGMGRSCLALIKGFKEFDPRINIAGVILNNAGSEYYKTQLKNSIEEELGLKVFGCLPKNKEITMPERYLGLLPAEENQRLREVLRQMADFVEAEVDLAGILQAAEKAPLLEGQALLDLGCPGDGREKVVIGVAKDEAFSFYYQDSLDYLEELGASLSFFSPLRDPSLPQVDGLYLGGGFPERFMEELTRNHSMQEYIRQAFAKGMPILAEGGGFMYLAKHAVDLQGQCWPGVGLIPATVEMIPKLAALGYVWATALDDSVLVSKGTVLRGHEFRYSVTRGLNTGQAAYSLVGGRGAAGRPEGYVKDNLIASYVHFHLRGNPAVAAGFMDACRRYRRSQL